MTTTLASAAGLAAELSPDPPLDAPRNRSAAVTLLLLAPPLGFLAVFFLYPLGGVLAEAASRNDAGLGVVADVLGDARLRGIVWFTTWQAALSTLLTFLVGLPLAHVLATYRFRGRRVVWSALTIPFVLPTVVVAAGFLALVGPDGLLGVDLDDSLAAVLAAHVFFNVAVVVRTLGGLWSVMDPAPVEAARTLGASPLRAFREATLPRLRPAALSAAAVVFLFTFSSFGVVVLLGGPGQQTIESEIWYQATRSFDLPTAGVLAVIQLFAVGAVSLLVGAAGKVGFGRERVLPRAGQRRTALRSAERLWVGGVLVVSGVLLAGPLLALVLAALETPDGIGLGNFNALWAQGPATTATVDVAEAVRNSVGVSLVAGLIAVLVGGCASLAVARLRPVAARSADVLLMLPLGASAVTVGFGMLVTLDAAPLDLRGSRWMLPIAQATIALPLVVRCVLPVARSVDGRLREAAAVLGARPWQVWREVDLAVLRRPLLAAAGLAVAVSLGEFGASAVLARSDFPTVPVAVFRLLGRPGPLNEGRAAALACLLMLATIVVVGLVDRFDRDGSRAW